jgi:hypothetical protein
MSLAPEGYPEVVLEFFDGQPEGLTRLAGEFPNEISLIEAKGFSALEYTLQALVVLTPVVGTQIASIVRAHIEAKKSVRIKADGVEVAGLSADESLRVLRELQERVK